MIQSNIASRIVTVVDAVIPCSAFVEETDNVPFCCYLVNSDEPIYDKSGVNGWRSSLSIYIVSDNYSEAETLKNSIITALDAAKNDTFFLKIANTSPDFSDGQWVFRIDINCITTNN